MPYALSDGNCSLVWKGEETSGYGHSNYKTEGFNCECKFRFCSYQPGMCCYEKRSISLTLILKNRLK